jgi:Bacterial conjugation TrbI-like protein
MRTFLYVGLAVVVVIVGALAWSFASGNGRPTPTGQQHPLPEGLQTTGFQSERKVAVVPTVTPRLVSNPAPTFVSHPEQQVSGEGISEPLSIRVYTGQKKAEQPEPPPEDMSEYAPYGRLIRCKLMNTVDSSLIQTPLIGLVENDLWWNGQVIVHRDSEVHGIAQADKSRERIAGEGAFTIVLYDPDEPGLGRELVVKGIVLDREDDPQFVTYGITDGSAGLAGMVIKTDKLAEVKLFVATLISGAAQGLTATSQSIFGTYNNPAGQSITGMSGYAINPITGAAQAALDRYAQMIEDAIERDGYFVRVPAGKQFYLYVTQAINLAKATVGGDPQRKHAEEEWLADRALVEKLTESRHIREQAEARQSQLPAQVSGFYGNQLERLTEALQQRSASSAEMARPERRSPLRPGHAPCHRA